MGDFKLYSEIIKGFKPGIGMTSGPSGTDCENLKRGESWSWPFFFIGRSVVLSQLSTIGDEQYMLEYVE